MLHKASEGPFSTWQQTCIYSLETQPEHRKMVPQMVCALLSKLYLYLSLIANNILYLFNLNEILECK